MSLTYFWLSSLSLCLYIDQPDAPFIFLIWLLAWFVVPRDRDRDRDGVFLFFLFLLIGRIIAFGAWGFAFFMQIAFLYVLNYIPRVNLTLSLSVYFVSLLAVYFVSLLAPLDPVPSLFSLSGALAIFFLYKARSGKDHFIRFLLYFINGIYICLLFNNGEAATSFFILNLFLIVIFSYLAYLVTHKQKGSQFSCEFIFLINKGKKEFFFLFYGVIGVLFAIYSPEMTLWATSLMGFIQILSFLFFSVLLALTWERGQAD